MDFDPSRFALVDQQNRDPDGKPSGGIKARPPYVIMTSQERIEARPELAPFVFQPDHIDNEWGGGDPPAVYLEFPNRETMVRLVGDPNPPRGGHGSGSYGSGAYGGSQDDGRRAVEISIPEPQVYSSHTTIDEREDLAARAASADWTGVDQRMDASPDLVDQVRAKVAELDALVERCGLTNHEQQRAKALTEAVVKLVSSPQPAWRLIVEILASPEATAIFRVKELALAAWLVIDLIVG